MSAPDSAQPRRARGSLRRAVLLGAAALMAVLWVLRPQADLPAPALDWAVLPRYADGAPSAVPAKGARVDRAATGDRLKVWGAIPAGARFELRIFRDDQLVFRCPPGCAVSNGRLAIDVALGVAGRYDAYVAVARRELPAPVDGRAADLQRAIEAGARVFAIPSIAVQ